MMSARPPDYQGLMRKKGRTPGWKERYFKLYGHMLVYYDKEVFKGDIDLRGAKVTFEKEGSLAFSLTGSQLKRQPIKLEVKTKELFDRWMQKLGEAGVDVGMKYRHEDTGVQWSCDLCTLLNKSSATRCAACGSAGPNVRGHQVAAVHPGHMATAAGVVDINRINVAEQAALLAQIQNQHQAAPVHSPAPAAAPQPAPVPPPQPQQVDAQPMPSPPPAPHAAPVPEATEFQPVPAAAYVPAPSDVPNVSTQPERSQAPVSGTLGSIPIAS
eukprot:TRINITY_DN13854_c0_g1_i2.p1 TRINITY_DN13854_c0_g1~~TRINITY_DN13854_c0_g1_i2.p1  ORF type:complete len:283 (+),score=67.32 TRINITY_DN13854_c0_g1_i2:40-849(+)